TGGDELKQARGLDVILRVGGDGRLVECRHERGIELREFLFDFVFTLGIAAVIRAEGDERRKQKQSDQMRKRWFHGCWKAGRQRQVRAMRALTRKVGDKTFFHSRSFSASQNVFLSHWHAWETRNSHPPLDVGGFSGNVSGALDASSLRG